MKTIDAIVVHCSATKEGKDFRARDIDMMHRQRGFSEIGYHYVVDLDGTVETGRSLMKEGAHCAASGFSGTSYNRHSIGVCYVGGLNAAGRAADTRTEAQKRALRVLLAKLVKEYPVREIIGHRDASPDLDGDGEVEPYEWQKECPCFDARTEYKDLLE